MLRTVFRSCRVWRSKALNSSSHGISTSANSGMRHTGRVRAIARLIPSNLCTKHLLLGAQVKYERYNASVVRIGPEALLRNLGVLDRVHTEV